jgi:pimeloyl-ACP methyl ester carboxylesterase
MAMFEDIVGRYLCLDVDNIRYRVYFEETGAGIPLLCQHTAGSDGRQYRHLLNDNEIAKDYRIIAYDLPYHGKSLPPVGLKWWQREYRLEKDFFMRFVVAFSKALELDRPVFMGSSMGGHLAPDLALNYPAEFRAVIGLESAISTPGFYLDWFYHPRISNDFKASLMYGLMSPTSPEKFRRETSWCYGQGAPAVFKGDLYYYCIDHDLTGRAQDIDTSQVAVYLLTGEYDFASPPFLSKMLAEEIRNAMFTEMKGLGHFPMCEDYRTFREYILPILDEIKRGRL